jgi:predicted transposase/invertase (TIGR01784 family)
MKTKEELLSEIDALQHVCEETKEMFRSMVMTMNHDMTPDELSEYMADLDNYEATYGLEATARRRGREEGLEEGRGERSLEIARALKEKGIDLQVIVDCTGLSAEEVAAL